MGNDVSSAAKGQLLTVGRHDVKIERKIGQGGFAYVFLVEDVSRAGGAKMLVLKRMRMPVDNEDATAIASREMEVLSSLPRLHPNLVHYVDGCVHELQPAPDPRGGGRSRGGGNPANDSLVDYDVLMEYCSGGSVEEEVAAFLRRGEHLPERRVLRRFRDLLSALVALHSQSPPVTHRDIKLENLLLAPLREDGSVVPAGALSAAADPDGAFHVVRLCDFGSCVLGRVRMDSAAAVALAESFIDKTTTLAYRAPELVDLHIVTGFSAAEDRSVGPESDVWAAGVALYKLCYGTTPFEDPHTGVPSRMAILNGSVSFPSSLALDPPYSEGLRGLIRACLVPDPRKRPTAAEVLQRGADMCAGWPERGMAPTTAGGAVAAGGAARRAAGAVVPVPQLSAAPEARSATRTQQQQQQGGDPGSARRPGSQGVSPLTSSGGNPQPPAPLPPRNASAVAPVWRQQQQQPTGGTGAMAAHQRGPSAAPRLQNTSAHARPLHAAPAGAVPSGRGGGLSSSATAFGAGGWDDDRAGVDTGVGDADWGALVSLPEQEQQQQKRVAAAPPLGAGRAAARMPNGPQARPAAQPQGAPSTAAAITLDDFEVPWAGGAGTGPGGGGVARGGSSHGRSVSVPTPSGSPGTLGNEPGPPSRQQQQQQRGAEAPQRNRSSIRLSEPVASAPVSGTPTPPDAFFAADAALFQFESSGAAVVAGPEDSERQQAQKRPQQRGAPGGGAVAPARRGAGSGGATSSSNVASSSGTVWDILGDGEADLRPLGDATADDGASGPDAHHHFAGSAGVAPMPTTKANNWGAGDGNELAPRGSSGAGTMRPLMRATGALLSNAASAAAGMLGSTMTSLSTSISAAAAAARGSDASASSSSSSSSSFGGVGGVLREQLQTRVMQLLGGERARQYRWVIKATSQLGGPPKAKYVRRLILDAWETAERGRASGASTSTNLGPREPEPHALLPAVFTFLPKRPVCKLPIVACKACAVVLRVVQQGPRSALGAAICLGPVFEAASHEWAAAAAAAAAFPAAAPPTPTQAAGREFAPPPPPPKYSGLVPGGSPAPPQQYGGGGAGGAECLPHGSSASCPKFLSFVAVYCGYVSAKLRFCAANRDVGAHWDMDRSLVAVGAPGPEGAPQPPCVALSPLLRRVAQGPLPEALRLVVALASLLGQLVCVATLSLEAEGVAAALAQPHRRGASVGRQLHNPNNLGAMQQVPGGEGGGAGPRGAGTKTAASTAAALPFTVSTTVGSLPPLLLESFELYCACVAALLLLRSRVTPEATPTSPHPATPTPASASQQVGEMTRSVDALLPALSAFYGAAAKMYEHGRLRTLLDANECVPSIAMGGPLLARPFAAGGSEGGSTYAPAVAFLAAAAGTASSSTVLAFPLSMSFSPATMGSALAAGSPRPGPSSGTPAPPSTRPRPQPPSTVATAASGIRLDPATLVLDPGPVGDVTRGLGAIKAVPGNEACVECGDRTGSSGWASINLGVLLCLRCSGIHRNLGVHITQVRSLTLDTWKPAWVRRVLAVGNTRANRYWEAALQQQRRAEGGAGPVKKPGPNSTMAEVGTWCRAKYEARAFAAEGPSPNEILEAAAEGLVPGVQSPSLLPQQQRPQPPLIASAAVGASAPRGLTSPSFSPSSVNPTAAPRPAAASAARSSPTGPGAPLPISAPRVPAPGGSSPDFGDVAALEAAFEAGGTPAPGGTATPGFGEFEFPAATDGQRGVEETGLGAFDPAPGSSSGSSSNPGASEFDAWGAGPSSSTSAAAAGSAWPAGGADDDGYYGGGGDPFAAPALSTATSAAPAVGAAFVFEPAEVDEAAVEEEGEADSLDDDPVDGGGTEEDEGLGSHGEGDDDEDEDDDHPAWRDIGGGGSPLPAPPMGIPGTLARSSSVRSAHLARQEDEANRLRILSLRASHLSWEMQQGEQR